MPSTTLLMQESSSQRHRELAMWKLKQWSDELIASTDYSFTSVSDGDTVVQYLSGLTINSGVVVTTSVRCKGLVLFIDGDCTINGTLTMTARGAISVGDNLAIDCVNANFLVNPADWSNYEYRIAAIGGAGHIVTTWPHSSGSLLDGNVGLLSCGGGGAGAYKGGSGSAGTSYSGGAGGGGAQTYYTKCNATANGGAGGAGYGTTPYGGNYGNGGAGNPGGTSNYGNSGGTGTGGLLSLIINGNLIIGSTGIISSNGSRGGSGGPNSACGGGSGGGNITILYTGTYSNSGTIQANGGTGGIGTINGGSGGAGSIVVSKF